MAVTGKTGADAMFKAIKRICINLNKYDAKLRATIAAAVTFGAITSAQGTAINAFLDTAQALCVAFEALAGYSGF